MSAGAEQRFAPIRIESPAHPPARVLTPHEASGIARPQPAVLTLSTPALLAEVNAGLAMRVCRQQTTARDVLLVQAMAARLELAGAAPVRGREVLEGMLLVDMPDESQARAPALTFERILPRFVPGQQEQTR